MIIEEADLGFNEDFKQPSYIDDKFMESKTYQYPEANEKLLQKINNYYEKIEKIINLREEATKLEILFNGSLEREKIIKENISKINLPKRNLTADQEKIINTKINDDTDKIINYLEKIFNEISQSELPLFSDTMLNSTSEPELSALNKLANFLI